MGCTIIGCGKAMPRRNVLNDELTSIVDTSDEWIVERTGIRSRGISTHESATDLGSAAARRAMGIAPGGWLLYPESIDPKTIDLVVCSTMTGDMLIPSQAALIRRELGLINAVCFDVNAACSGCVYGFEITENLITASALAPRRDRNPIRRALLVGLDRLSHVVNWHDRSTCVLFGDGAGAAVLEWHDDEPGILSSFLKNTDDETGALTAGNVYDLSTFPFAEGLPIPESGFVAADFPGSDSDAIDSDQSQHPENAEALFDGTLNAEALFDGTLNAEALFNGAHFLVMNGQRVFKFATAAIIESLTVALDRAGLSIQDLACIVPHQANERIIRYAAKKLGVPLDLFQISIGTTGNTSAASVPMALYDAYAAGRIHKGDYVALVGFGGGFTSGALVFQSR